MFVSLENLEASDMMPPLNSEPLYWFSNGQVNIRAFGSSCSLDSLEPAGTLDGSDD